MKARRRKETDRKHIRANRTLLAIALGVVIGNKCAERIPAGLSPRDYKHALQFRRERGLMGKELIDFCSRFTSASGLRLTFETAEERSGVPLDWTLPVRLANVLDAYLDGDEQQWADMGEERILARSAGVDRMGVLDRIPRKSRERRCG